MLADFIERLVRDGGRNIGMLSWDEGGWRG